jgi:hypothetical protein
VAAPLPRSVPDADSSVIYEFAMDNYSEKIPDSRFEAQHHYRKSALFDRLLTFDVQMDFAQGPLH